MSDERSYVKLADLTEGTRIRHIRWCTTGTIQVADGQVSVVWDGSGIETQITEEGAVWPEDVEILQPGRDRDA